MHIASKQFLLKTGKFFDNAIHTICINKDLLLKILFFALLAYTIWSVFPISPIEADGVGIANGVEVMKKHGFVDNEFAYRFPVQPGSYLIIFAISKLFNIKAYLAFSLISAITSIVFIFSSSYLLSKITDGNFYLIGILHFLFQESLAVAAYANTTIIACAFILLGIIPLFKWDKAVSGILSALLIGFGVFCRLDIGLMIIPFTIVLIIKKKKLPANLLISGVLSIILFYALLLINQVSIQQITHLFRVHSGAHFLNESISEFSIIGYKDIRSFISFFSIACLGLIFLGILYMIQQKKWQSFTFFLFGTVPFFSIFFGSLTSPRYILTTLPFFLLSVFYGIQLLITEKTPLKKGISIFLIMFFVGQYFLGIQVDVSSKPYREEMKPILVNLLSIPNPTDSIQNIKVVIGSGSSISTDDGYRLTSGMFYFPIFWHHEKAKKLTNIESLNNYLITDTQSTLGIICNDLDACQLSKNLLLSNDYELTKINENVYTASGINNISFFNQHNGNDFSTIQKNLTTLTDEHILFISTIPGTNYTILENIASLKKITDLVYIFNK